MVQRRKNCKMKCGVCKKRFEEPYVIGTLEFNTPSLMVKKEFYLCNNCVDIFQDKCSVYIIERIDKND
jgi:hypothetical protein